MLPSWGSKTGPTPFSFLSSIFPSSSLPPSEWTPPSRHWFCSHIWPDWPSSYEEHGAYIYKTVIQDCYRVSQVPLTSLRNVFTSPRDQDRETVLVIAQPTGLCPKVSWLSTWSPVALVLLIDNLPSATLPPPQPNVASYTHTSAHFHWIWFWKSRF